MAEDTHNPLNNPDAPLSQAPPPAREEPPQADPELESFLDDVFSPEAQTVDEPEDTPAPLPDQAGAPAASHQPVPAASTTPDPGVPQTQPPADDLQKQVMQELLTKLQAMPTQQGQPEPQQAQQQLTPEIIRQQMKPVVDQYVQAGWISEDMAALYPQEATAMAWMYSTISQLQQSNNQALQYIQSTQQRDVGNQAATTLDSAITEVSGRGDVFDALKDDGVRQGFRDYIIELNPLMSQLTPDFLARQYYAYNHQLILDTAKAAAAPTQKKSAAALAKQEGSSARQAPTSAPQEEWADMLAGVLPGL